MKPGSKTAQKRPKQAGKRENAKTSQNVGVLKRNRDPASVAELVADPANRRLHNPRNLGMIADALRDVGASRSIVIDENNVVLAGNGVTTAAADAGITRVRVVDAQGDELIAVRRSGLTDAQKRALALYDNRTAELAEWNPGQLRADLAAGLALDPWWTPAELAELVDQSAPKPGLTDPDDIPATRPTKIKRGDLFALGKHRLLCGDCTAPAALSTLGPAQITVTDPPYGIGAKYADYDDSDAAANGELVKSALGLGPPAKVWTPGLMNLSRALAVFPDARVLCWHKKFAAAGNGLGGASTWEPILVVGVEYRQLGNDFLEFMTDRVPGLHELHPCPKPVALFVELIRSLVAPGDTLYEPFAGAGSTMIAAEQTGRACLAIEISPAYCQVIVDRWEAFTGNKASKVKR